MPHQALYSSCTERERQGTGLTKGTSPHMMGKPLHVQYRFSEVVIAYIPSYFIGY